MNPIALYLAWRSRRRLAKHYAADQKRRSALIEQIGARKQQHREWKPMLGDLRRATTEMLRAEVALSAPLKRGEA